MLSFPKILAWPTWRWRTVTSTLRSRSRTLTLRELLGSLQAHRNRTAAQSPHLLDLISLVKGDVKSSERFPLRSGGPDTPRSLGAWKSRYNHLDRYLASEEPSMDCGQDVAGAQALSAAEYEGWPLGATQPSQNGR